jgi:phytoene/squalene synthetase
MAAIYTALLTEIERSRYDVFRRRIRVRRPRQALIAAFTWLKIRLSLK